ncbi:MAG: tetratricopeptide repeat protein [Egibacteraceae bacterium]
MRPQALLALGFTGSAVERYRELVREHERLAAAEPDRADYQRDLSVSYERLADLVGALGQGEQARELCTASLDIRQRLAAAEPDRADYQRDLSVSYERLADLAAESPDGKGDARDWLSRAVEIRRLQHRREPERVDLAEELAVSLRLFTKAVEEPGGREHIIQEVIVLLAPFEQRGTITSKGTALLVWARQ